MKERASENKRLIKTIESKRRDFYDYTYIYIYIRCIYYINIYIYVYILGRIHTHNVIQPKYIEIFAYGRARALNIKTRKNLNLSNCLVFYAKLMKVSKVMV